MSLMMPGWSGPTIVTRRCERSDLSKRRRPKRRARHQLERAAVDLSEEFILLDRHLVAAASHRREDARPDEARRRDPRDATPHRHEGEVDEGRRDPHLPQGDEVLLHVDLVLADGAHRVGRLGGDKVLDHVEDGEVHERVVDHLVEEDLQEQVADARRVGELLEIVLAEKAAADGKRREKSGT